MGLNNKQIKMTLSNGGKKITTMELKENLGIEDNTNLLLCTLKFISKELGNIRYNEDGSKYNYLYCGINVILKVISEDPKIVSLEVFRKMQKVKNILEQKLAEKGTSNSLKKFYNKMLDLVNPMTQILDKKTKKEQKKEYEQISNTNLYKFTSKLIFEVKNFDYVCQMSKIYPDMINCTDDKGMPIIYEIIKKQFSNLKKKSSDKNIAYFSRVINYIINYNEFYLTEKQLKNILIYLRKNLCNLESKDLQNNELINFMRSLLDNFKDKSRMHTIPRNVRDLCKKYNINEIDDDYLMDTIQTKRSNKIVDYTDKLVISMDLSNNVRIFDDAISCEFLPNGNYLIGVYIADVASLIPYGSPLDKLAYKRAETIYLNDRVIDMLPKNLAFKCSLNTNGIKKVVAYMFEFTKDIELHGFTVEHAIINVNSNLTFNAGQKLYSLSHKTNDEIGKMIRTLIDFNRQFRSSNFYNLDYHILKRELRKAENAYEYHCDNDCSHLVSALMILVNKSMAKHFYDNGYPFLYRVNNSDMDAELIRQIKEAANEKYLPVELVGKIDNVYSKSSYSENSLGHNGLKLDHYCHTTNPIRNYASLFTQRMIIDKFINGGIPDDLLKRYEQDLPLIATNLNLQSDINSNFRDAYNKIQKKFTRK